MHTVFVRYHNKLAQQLAAFNRHWSDEKTFQETRKIIGAVLQLITYREFLPLVLGNTKLTNFVCTTNKKISVNIFPGPDVMKIFDLDVLRKAEYYGGYDPTVNPHIANEFATAAYRFGHSLVQGSFHRFDKHHRLIIDSEFSNSCKNVLK